MNIRVKDTKTGSKFTNVHVFCRKRNKKHETNVVHLFAIHLEKQRDINEIQETESSGREKT